jgi:hypothetical protein
MWGFGMLLMLWLGLGCEFASSFPPFLVSSSRFHLKKGLSERKIADVNSIFFGILYWYLYFVAIPKWKGYRVEEEVEVLSDGTSITRLVNVKDE